MKDYHIGAYTYSHDNIMEIGKAIAQVLFEIGAHTDPIETYIALMINARKIRKGLIERIENAQGSEMVDKFVSQTDEVIDNIVNEMLQRRKGQQ